LEIEKERERRCVGQKETKEVEKRGKRERRGDQAKYKELFNKRKGRKGRREGVNRRGGIKNGGVMQSIGPVGQRGSQSGE
jgi:hypothetical protein